MSVQPAFLLAVFLHERKHIILSPPCFEVINGKAIHVDLAESKQDQFGLEKEVLEKRRAWKPLPLVDDMYILEALFHLQQCILAAVGKSKIKCSAVLLCFQWVHSESTWIRAWKTWNSCQDSWIYKPATWNQRKRHESWGSWSKAGESATPLPDRSAFDSSICFDNPRTPLDKWKRLLVALVLSPLFDLQGFGMPIRPQMMGCLAKISWPCHM